jgi:hypothetical protein
VTAAVVGVILYLAVLLGGATVQPAGAAGADVFAIVLIVFAFMVLARDRVSVPVLVLSGGLAGLLRAILA